MRREARHHQTAWHFQWQDFCRHQLPSPHNGAWQCQPLSQWYRDCLKGGWSRVSLIIPCLWTFLTPPLVGTLLKLWSIQERVYKNEKGLLWSLFLWYAPSSWWHRVPCLENLHDAWWMSLSLDSPSSPPKNIDLQAPSPKTSPYAICSETCHW